MGDRYYNKAQQLAEESQEEIDQLSPGELRSLLHELKVQRIAAELQAEELRTAWDSLERSRNEFRALFEGAPVGYAVLDEHGIIHRANGEFARLVEKASAELVGTALVNYLHEDEQHLFLSRFRSMFRSPDGKSLVLRLRHSGATPRVVRLQISRQDVPSAGSGAYPEESAFLIMSDISELKFREQELEVSTERYRLLFEAGADAKFVHGLEGDGGAGKFIEVNDVACDRLGYSREELLTLGPQDLDAPQYSDRIRKIVQELKVKGSLLFETVHLTKDRREIPVEISAHVFTLGSTRAVLSVARDISRRREAEAARQQKEAYLERVLSAISDQLAVIDGEYTIHDVNDRFLETYGYTREEVIGRPCYEVTRGLDRPCSSAGVDCPLEKVLQTAETRSAYHRHATKEGREKVVELSFFPMPMGDEHPRLAVEVGRDVSELVEANRVLSTKQEVLKTRAAVYESLAKASKPGEYNGLLTPLVEKFGASCGLLAFPDTGDAVRVVAQKAPKGGRCIPPKLPNHEPGSLLLRAIKTRTIQNSLQDHEAGPSGDSSGHPWAGVEHGIAVPLLAGNQVVGVCFLGRDGAPFTTDDEELLGDVAGLLAPFLKDRKKLEREEQLRRRAEQKIEASLREKEVLLREIHHRVKNNLQVIVSLLGMTADRSENPEALAVLEESRSRVYSMALVHQTLYSSNTLSYVDMNRYIPRLVQAIQSALCNPSRISVTGKSSDVEVDLDQAVPLGLIINELVSNAIKHGFPDGREGLVVVELVEQEQNLLLTVRDNGVGLNPGESYETEHSLGLHLVRAMAEQLGGILATRNQGGTVVELQFPRVPTPRPQEPGE